MPAGAGPAGALRRWGVWLVVVAAVVAALVIGASRSGPQTLDQRVHSLASQVRCPVCQGESAADSQVPAAAAIRDQIRQELVAGKSSPQVLSDLVGEYNTAILEKPQARGVGLLVWIIPVLVVAAGAAGLVLAFARWKRTGRPAGPAPAAEDEALVAEALAAPRRPGSRR